MAKPTQGELEDIFRPEDNKDNLITMQEQPGEGCDHDLSDYETFSGKVYQTCSKCHVFLKDGRVVL